jgi:subtilisin family serine protease
MGNTGGGDHYTPFYPAAVHGMIAVGAVGPSDDALPFSRRGDHIAVTAPGIAIWSTLPTYAGKWGYRREGPDDWRPIWRNQRFDAWLGTSAACAHVTAAVALLIAKRGRMAWRDVRARLMSTADNTPGMRRKRFDRTFGAGRLNVARLLAR